MFKVGEKYKIYKKHNSGIKGEEMGKGCCGTYPGA